MAFFCSLLSAFCFAENGAYPSTRHGDPSLGPQRRLDRPRGGCSQCHEYSVDPALPGNEYALFAPNDNNLCATCHSVPSEDGVFQGSATWQQSSHARASSSIDAGKCIHCHDPHGVKDDKGVIPAMLSGREPAMCLACHDASSARTNIRDQLTKPYWHGMQSLGTHDPREGSDPARYAAAPFPNRHVACSDCHNSHRAIKERIAADAPAAPSLLAGVARVQVTNNAAGMAPNYTFRAADDPSSANEYEICFKCHSGWTKQPTGQTDLALVTNPANPSFHPIQAVGKNSKIDRNSFVDGFGADTIIGCTACHGTDDTTVGGMHGSSYRYLLRKPVGSTSRDDLCFSCHSYEVYANPAAAPELQAASRFNDGTGHAFHVGLKNINCGSCHETHGSTRLPFLLVKNRLPGITSYTETPGGGTCATSCHATETYAVTYPR